MSDPKFRESTLLLLLDGGAGVGTHFLEWGRQAESQWELRIFSNEEDVLAISGQENVVAVFLDQKFSAPENVARKHLREVIPGVPLVLIREGRAIEHAFELMNAGVVDRSVARGASPQELDQFLTGIIGSAPLRQLREGRGDSKEPSGESLREARGALEIQKEHLLGLCFRILHSFYPLLAIRTQAVVEICRRMSNTGFFNEEERRGLQTASWIYDLGLIAIERSVLHRMFFPDESMDLEESDLFKHHPIIGQTLAAFVDPLRAVGEIVRSHHERFDGEGYPDGVAGHRIPWAARCLAVAVAFTESDLPRLEAAEKIQEQSGSAFDPEAVRLFFQTNPVSRLPDNVREVLMGELGVGMRLARGIVTRSGMLLMPKGRELSSQEVAKLRNHAQLNLVTERILIYR